MRNIMHSPDLPEAKATALMFNACRGNSRRVPVTLNGGEFSASFRLLANGDHEVALRNKDGVTVALALVDQYD